MGADPERMWVLAAGQGHANDLREQVAPVDLVADRPRAIEVNRRASGRPRNRKRHQPQVMRLVTTFPKAGETVSSRALVLGVRPAARGS